MNGRAPRAFNVATTAATTSAMRSMPRLPAPTAIRLPRQSSPARSASRRPAASAAGFSGAWLGSRASPSICAGSMTASLSLRRGLHRLRIPRVRPLLEIAEVAHHRRPRRPQAEDGVLDHRRVAADGREEVPEVVLGVVVVPRRTVGLDLERQELGGRVGILGPVLLHELLL